MLTTIAEPLPAWPKPPPGGYTADDLDRIPNLPPHTELIDGGLVFVSPQKLFHMRAVNVLFNGLERHAPKDRFRVRREMSVILDSRQRPEPDVIVVRADVPEGRDLTWYPAEAVVLAVEVVSPDSEVRDRERKPQLYARAGIRYFWRVEDVSGKTTVYAFELEPATKTYVPAKIFHDNVVLDVPFSLEIDLTEIDQL